MYFNLVFCVTFHLMEFIFTLQMSPPIPDSPWCSLMATVMTDDARARSDEAEEPRLTDGWTVRRTRATPTWSEGCGRTH